MATEHCVDSEQKWREVEEISARALENRIRLWNAIEEQMEMEMEMEIEMV